ncbi:MAG: hypothetical protein ACXVYY_10200 [Oryzihumus sp.]
MSRDLRRLSLGLLVIPVLTACGGTGSGTTASGTSTVRQGVHADARTAVIATVEVKRQCDIGTQSFPKEADITADLDKRLAAAGVGHLEWKHWHDELATSPELVSQFRQVSARGC